MLPGSWKTVQKMPIWTAVPRPTSPPRSHVLQSLRPLRKPREDSGLCSTSPETSICITNGTLVSGVPYSSRLQQQLQSRGNLLLEIVFANTVPFSQTLGCL
ncbi:hypothetical protein P7K49_000183 [Saguinus oedipus]|uniref:Uncharacterized protein n=1 Tax=Saguinus oedipus TaxID=9490 RepID=A0ABQ9WB11_SAGOE|nr:hypothetical protein P7K49_000183 [Saguinus oedipus]